MAVAGPVDIAHGAIYTSGLGELLGTVSHTSGQTSAWSGLTKLDTPDGGWTWTKVKNLEIKLYKTGASDQIIIYKIEAIVVSSKAELDYVFMDETGTPDILFKSLSFITEYTQAIQAKGNIVTTVQYTQTVEAKGKIQKTRTQTVISQGRIEKTLTQTITSKGKIQITSQQTVTGKGRIEIISTQSLTAKASIKKEFTQTITALGRVQKQFVQSIQSKGRIQISSTQTIESKGRIQKIKTQTVLAKGSIKKTFSQTVQARGNIVFTQTQTILALGRIEKQFTQTINAKASIQKQFIQTLEGKGRIGKGFTQSLTAKGRITITPSQSITAKGRIITVIYTREAKVTLPTDDADLATLFSDAEISDVATDDSNRVALTGTGYLIKQFKNRATGNKPVNGKWNGQVSLAPTSATVYLQVYNRNTTTWETLASNNTADADTDFNLKGSVSEDLSDYYDAGFWIAFRVYQEN